MSSTVRENVRAKSRWSWFCRFLFWAFWTLHPPPTHVQSAMFLPQASTCVSRTLLARHHDILIITNKSLPKPTSYKLGNAFPFLSPPLSSHHAAARGCTHCFQARERQHTWLTHDCTLYSVPCILYPPNKTTRQVLRLLHKKGFQRKLTEARSTHKRSTLENTLQLYS